MFACNPLGGKYVVYGTGKVCCFWQAQNCPYNCTGDHETANYKHLPQGQLVERLFAIYLSKLDIFVQDLNPHSTTHSLKTLWRVMIMLFL